MFRLTYVIIPVLVLALIGGADVTAQDRESISVFEKQCAKNQRADDYPFWEFIENNAKRSADEYAMDHDPRATFIPAKVDVVFQAAGEHAGEYLVKLLYSSPGATSFAMLRPNFDFCADPSGLDDSRYDLFTVVSAKFNGRSF